MDKELGHGPIRCDLDEVDKRSLWVLMRDAEDDGWHFWPAQEEDVERAGYAKKPDA